MDTKTKKQKDKIKLMSQEPYAEEMMRMFEEQDTHNYDVELHEGAVIEGKLLGQTKSHIVVDFGYKDFVLVEKKRDEYAALEKMGKTDNDDVSVYITEVSENPYMIKGSFAHIQKEAVYTDIIENSNEEAIPALIKEWTPAGYILVLNYDSMKIPAFMPNTLSGINKVADEESLVGQELYVMIESYDPLKGTFIASRKKYLQNMIPQALSELQIVDEAGEPVLHRGIVTGSVKFGIFVEFNECLTGMIHKANMAPEWEAQLGSVKPGSEIEFYVKENVRGKLILTQVWRTTLWDTIKKDDVFEKAVVKDVKNIGLLVQLDDETMGLVKQNDLSKSSKSYKAGDTVSVKVYNVYRSDRKIFLSIQ
jgi:ribosomal protein S1